ncbi:MAG: hypothetical protein JWN70_2560, partial [Planctomycetaceae bacterium]|nr:hypothetical protein [Planctomycetaceae bacterium]
AVAAVALLYFASIGPACWMASRSPERHDKLLSLIYAPIVWTYGGSPLWSQQIITDYVNCGRAQPRFIYVFEPPNIRRVRARDYFGTLTQRKGWRRP